MTMIHPAARRGRAVSTCLAVCLVAAACGGGSSPTAPSSGPSLTATFSSIQSVVFQQRCVSCHNGAVQTPDLRAGAAYASLVNAPSTETNLLRVAPGDPEASYLIHKLEGRAGIVGDRMPLGGPFLSSADIAVIRSWIQAGAPNN